MLHPLDGYRVVDFGSAWAGPQMAHIISDMGAEVIKVESRTRIDYGRMGGAASSKDLLVKSPEAIAAAAPERLELNPVFHLLNRGKRGITVDFTRPEGSDLIRELVLRSDVVTDNFTPGVLDKYGLGYQSLAAIKPDIIVVSLCFAGHTGPLKGTRGYAPIITALAGLDSVVGYPDETIPCGPRFAYGDHVAATYGALAILVALVHRNRTGEGQYIDISEWEATTSLLGEPLMEYVMNRRIPAPAGNRDSQMAPHGYYPCRGVDQWVSIAVKTDEEWLGLSRAMENPHWTSARRFSDRYGRLSNQDELDRLVAEWTVNYTSREVTVILQSHGVAAAPFLNARDQHGDPHFREREIYVEVEHPRSGKETFYGIPWKLSETPGKIRGSGPMLGQDNEYIFKTLLGLPEGEFNRLANEKIIY
ncbi:MAG: CoA transferase [Dehalococcoidia bacterium]|nr:CoA transferase [Dehalococcoidia bacterium]